MACRSLTACIQLRCTRPAIYRPNGYRQGLSSVPLNAGLSVVKRTKKEVLMCGDHKDLVTSTVPQLFPSSFPLHLFTSTDWHMPAPAGLMASPRQKLVSDSESEEPLQDDAQCNTHHELPEDDTIVLPNLPSKLPIECSIDSSMFPGSYYISSRALPLAAAGQLAMTAVMKVRAVR